MKIFALFTALVLTGALPTETVEDAVSLLQRAVSRRPEEISEPSDYEEISEPDEFLENDAEEDPEEDPEETTSTTTTQSCTVPAECVLDLKTVSENDIRGTAGSIRYDEVCSSEGKSIDLVVTSDTKKYRPPGAHGVKGSFGWIGMMSRNTATFRFSFVATGTNEPVKVKSVDFTFYDIDGTKTFKERLVLTGYTSYALHVNSVLKRRLSKGMAIFTSNRKTVPNPRQPHRLKAVQLKRSVQARYESVSSFTATWSIFKSKRKKTRGGHRRNFFFAGVAALSESCTTTVCQSTQSSCSIEFAKSKLVRSNLGGAGPDSGAAELRYGSVCSVKGAALDLVVTAVSPYTPKDATQTGVNGLYGMINVIGGSSVDLKFQFVKSGTSTPVKPGATDITILDLDGHPSGAQEFVSATDYASSTMGENATVTHKVVSTSPLKSSFTSTVVGHGDDNPSDPMKLTPLQASRSVSLQFVNADSFLLSFGVSGDSSIGGRNFIFSGKSSINSNMCTTSADSSD